MGNSLSSVREEAGRIGDEEEMLVSDALSSMEDFAELRSKVFYQITRKENDFSSVAARRYLADGYMMRCGVDPDKQTITRWISQNFESLVDSVAAEGISSVVSLSIKSMLARPKRSNEMKEYFVVVGELGKTYRIDLDLYIYRFDSAAMKQVAPNVVIASMVLSTMNMARVDDITLASLIQSSYWAACPQTQQKLYEKLRMMRVNAKLMRYRYDGNQDAVAAFQDGISL